MSEEAAEVGSRMPTDEEIDMQQLSELLDTALSSDNAVVKDQLRKLLVITALSTSGDPLRKAFGPFTRMAEDVRRLKQEVRQIQSTLNSVENDPEYKYKTMVEYEVLANKISSKPMPRGLLPISKDELEKKNLANDIWEKLKLKKKE